MAAPDEIFRISTECEDNVDGCHGVIVYDNETFPISIQRDDIQMTAYSDGQGLQRSVRVFQWPLYIGEDIAVLQGSPENVRDSNTSLEEEVDEDE